jgi:hypothetical protein
LRKFRSYPITRDETSLNALRKNALRHVLSHNEATSSLALSA